MKLTKHKTDREGVWELRVDGRALPYTLEKGDKPAYREPQEWFIAKGEYVFCSGRSASALVGFLQDFLNEVSQ